MSIHHPWHSRSGLGWLACLTLTALGAWLPATAAVAGGGDDTGFELSVGLQGLPDYFPGLIGNGYVTTLTAPRGTEPAQTYMVALMDYTPGDVSRPALVPGWTGIDFNPGAVGSGHTWLNGSPLTAADFADYRQVLDLHEGTLTTHYRYEDFGRQTGIEVVTLVSQASPHVAATRISITPDYTGWVRLSFPLTLWIQHSPRFPLARMTGPEMEQALAKAGLSLQPHPPATSDRAAIWYPGYVEIGATGGDARSRTLSLTGRAANGLGMAMAAAVDLPAQTHGAKVTLRRGGNQLVLEVALRVARGHTYAFTKYVAMSRAGWGGGAAADLILARQARAAGFSRLLQANRGAWQRLWQSDIVIDGDPRAQQVARSELYYLLINTTPDTAWAPGPCGLTPCYAGHVFWDSDTWMFPALLLLHPRRAESLVAYRESALPAAEQRARQHGLAGAMYPWEADPQNGSDQTPHSAIVLSESEIHVNSEVAFAQWQYYLATLDRDWLAKRAWPVIRAVARFWASRATYDARTGHYELLHVTSVSESNSDISNDTYTNMEAAQALRIATTAADVLGERADPSWNRIASEMYIPLAPGGAHHLPFDPSVVIRGRHPAGPLDLLFLPALDLPLSARLRRGDFDYAIHPNPPASAGNFSMAMLPPATAADEVGRGDSAAAWLNLYVTGGTLKPPFNIRTETTDNEVGPFLTGTGGYLQGLEYGLTGLRIRQSGLVDAYAPVLPQGWHSLTLRNVTFRGRHFDVRVTRGSTGAASLSLADH
ncbi:MAG TPA: glycosyl hydrolase family 65 protein [Steroidobacteraceae bacterium]|nr:glycosyl hydrolase family 65 protein [Steroidobacteraceae bacterium]